jgi:hypothetical protein
VTVFAPAAAPTGYVGLLGPGGGEEASAIRLRAYSIARLHLHSLHLPQVILRMILPVSDPAQQRSKTSATRYLVRRCLLLVLGGGFRIRCLLRGWRTGPYALQRA